MPLPYFHGKRVSACHLTLLVAYERERHAALHINQGRRTFAEQAAFYAAYLRGGTLAARPTPWAPHIKLGHEHHALDINAPHPAQDVAAFYRGKGVHVAFNVPGEPWHMDVTDEDSLKRAAARLDGQTGDPILKQGQTGPSVVRLKKLLYTGGIRQFSAGGSSNRYDPYFSKYTASAVRRFQVTHKLKADGRVGPKTWCALRA